MTVHKLAVRRSKGVARRALSFALDPTITPAQAGTLLVDLAAGNATTLRLARARVLRASVNGPITKQAARALGLGLQAVQRSGGAAVRSIDDFRDRDLQATPFRLVLIGPPGAGKGTQGVRLAEHLGIAHISTGELLRAVAAEQTPLASLTQRFMKSGHLVPDALVLELLGARLGHPAVRKRGFILDGFPRTLEQAEALAALLDPDGIDAVIELEIPAETAAARLRVRARGDDSGSAIMCRFEEYERETGPVVRWYENRSLVLPVDGDRPAAAVTIDLLEHLDGVQPAKTTTANPKWLAII